MGGSPITGVLEGFDDLAAEEHEKDGDRYDTKHGASHQPAPVRYPRRLAVIENALIATAITRTFFKRGRTRNGQKNSFQAFNTDKIVSVARAERWIGSTTPKEDRKSSLLHQCERILPIPGGWTRTSGAGRKTAKRRH